MPAEVTHTSTAERRRVVGYVRVSTREQAENGASLDSQREQIQAECDRRGWHLVVVCDDPAASGKDMRKRPGLEAALDILRDGHANVLVAAKLDRLSRSVLDFATIAELAKEQKWALVVLDVGADTSTPAGEMLTNVMAAFAQYERRIIGQRTREGLAVKRAQGVRLGRPPVMDVQVVARIKRERESGWTLQKIADGLNADGVPTPRDAVRWYPSSIRWALNRQASAAVAP